MNLRRLAERMSRGMVLRRHLPAEFNRLPIYVSPEAGLRYWRRHLEKVDPPLLRMVRELVKPGSVVWDIGANVGLFSLSAAALAGPSGSVLAIEPDLWLANLLSKSARRAHLSKQAARIDVLCAAITETPGICQLQIAERSRASNHLSQAHGSTQAEGVRHTQQTVAVSLDFLQDHLPAPMVLKIDVESAEISVLRGASRLLQTARPVVLCEVTPENSDTVANILYQHKYELFEADTEPAQRQPVRRAPWSTLAIPIV
jgi:FkbM family methyltransferase